MDKIYLAGGCFWCIADYLLSFNGIIDVVVGYSGGEEKDVNYQLVKSQSTKHRETVEVIYDETQISKEEIIDIYLSYIDPTDKEGQYIDKGHSYTLAMYYRYEEERKIFTNKKLEEEKKINQEAYIAIEPFKFFIKAEEYHQHYSEKNIIEFNNELKESGRTCHLRRRNIN